MRQVMRVIGIFATARLLILPPALAMGLSQSSGSLAIVAATVIGTMVSNMLNKQ